MTKSPATSKQVQKKKRGSTGASFDNLELFLLHLPTTIWYLIFCYAPMFGVVIAFKNYKPKPGKSFLWALINNSKWAGFDNFKFLFTSGRLWALTRNTVAYNFAFLMLANKISKRTTGSGLL